MKNNQNILLLLALGVILPACKQHDKMDDLVFVGKMAPQVNWSIPSTVVSAGSDVDFSVQYYTTAEAPIKTLEVWYNLYETETKNVAAPWVVSKSFAVTYEVSAEKRISQKIKSFAHDESTWNDKERAYKFDDKFPTSNTLTRIAWSGKEFSLEKVDKNFGEGFWQNFKDSLHTYLIDNPDAAYKDFETLVKVDSVWQVDYFQPYVTQTFDENIGTEYAHFVDHKVPQKLDSLFQTLTFKDIISNTAGELSISYSRSYTIDAQLKCIDEDNTVGLTTLTTITLN